MNFHLNKRINRKVGVEVKHMAIQRWVAMDLHRLVRVAAKVGVVIHIHKAAKGVA